MDVTASVVHVVGSEHTARAVGSGDLEVLGTPVVLAWCEEATCAALTLPDHATSVGVRVALEHLAASAIGSTVTATATGRLDDDGRRAELVVEATDETGRLLARGTVVRAVVDRERFLARVPAVEE